MLAQLDEQQHLTELGLESLMAMELTHRIKTDLGVDLSALEFMGDTTLVEICNPNRKGLTYKSATVFSQSFTISSQSIFKIPNDCNPPTRRK